MSNESKKNDIAGYPKEEWIIAGVIAVVGIPLLLWYTSSNDDTPTTKSNSSSGDYIKIQNCRDKIKKQLNYPAEAKFYLFTGSKVTPEFTGITFDAKNAFGVKTEYYGFCKANGTVLIRKRE